MLIALIALFLLGALLAVYKMDELVDKDHKQIRTFAGSAIKYDPFNSLYHMIFGNAEGSSSVKTMPLDTIKKQFD